MYYIYIAVSHFWLTLAFHLFGIIVRCSDWIFTLPEWERGVTEPCMLPYRVLQSLRILILDCFETRKKLRSALNFLLFSHYIE